MRVRVALAAACIGALACAVSACNRSPAGKHAGPPGGHQDTDITVYLDSSCQIYKDDKSAAFTGKTIHWKVHSRCPGTANTPFQISFSLTGNQVAPIANCPCSGTINNGGELTLSLGVLPDATSDVYTYTITINGKTYDPYLEIDPS